MAAYPELDVSDLVSFSGRLTSDYSGYAATALKQAILLFKLGTCLNEFPDDAIKAELAQTAILAMADAIYLAQPFQSVLSNPFSSETIGSYSYSKVAGAVAGALPTGITWFDIAVSQLGVCELTDHVPSGGGIEIFENDALFAAGVHPDNLRMLAPQDLNELRSFGYDPAPRY